VSHKFFHHWDEGKKMRQMRGIFHLFEWIGGGFFGRHGFYLIFVVD